jgi:uncharacterized protein YaiL (DUF2058 family)
MKSLKEQLLKAKLVNKKQVRKAEHEQRQQKKELGREGIEKEKARLRKEREEKERKRREEQRRQEQIRKEEELARGGLQRIRALVTGADLSRYGSGSNSFYFKSSKGTISCLEVSGTMAERLESGRAAIVELPGDPFPDFFIVPADIAEQVLRAEPDAVRFWNQE